MRRERSNNIFLCLLYLLSPSITGKLEISVDTRIPDAECQAILTRGIQVKTTHHSATESNNKQFLKFYRPVFLCLRFREHSGNRGRPARTSIRSGAAEYAGLFQYDGLTAKLLRPWESNASRHLDNQSGSEISHRSSRAKVSN